MGEIDELQVHSIREELESLKPIVQPFTLKLDRLGTFGEPISPSILWAGIQGELKALHLVYQQVEERMEKVGFSPENRSYRPHITLAKRYKGEEKFSLENSNHILYAASSADTNDISWEASSLILYQTHLKNTPMYEPIHSFHF